MLDNKKLNKRIQKIFKDLKDKWRLTPFRISEETGIPHSSLKYMRDEKFDWKLNHLLAIVDFLNRYGVVVSLTDLLDFSEKKSFEQIYDTTKADFRGALLNKGNAIAKKLVKKSKGKSQAINHINEAENLASEICEITKENRLNKNAKINIVIKIIGKNIDFRKEIKTI